MKTFLQVCFPMSFGKAEGRVHYAVQAAMNKGMEVYHIDWKPDPRDAGRYKYVASVDRGSASDAAKPGSPVVIRLYRHGFRSASVAYFVEGVWYQRISWKDLDVASRVHPVFMFRKNVFREFVRKADADLVPAMERELEELNQAL